MWASYQNNPRIIVKGFAHYFLISFSSNNCDWTRSFCTSTNLPKDTRGRPAFDVNVRSLLASREIGKGHTTMSKFCGFMNMPKSMNLKSFNDCAKIVKESDMLKQHVIVW